MHFEPIRPEHDAALADLVRRTLKARGLDIPGTAYFDDSLDHLSAYYSRPSRAYYVLLENGNVIGGIGLAECGVFPGCCEMQKLYLEEAFHGRRIGYEMVGYLERRAAEAAYRQVYLETHTNLQAAIHLYERCGYYKDDIESVGLAGIEGLQ